MSRASHTTAEKLSAYLDGQLRPVEAERVEAHLAACPVCQRDLEGMQQVVSSLHHLERMKPPSSVKRAVVHRIAFEGQREDLITRLERGFSVFNRQSPILFLFALIMALAIMVFFFAYALHQEQNATTPVLFEAPVRAVPPAEGERRTVAERDFHLREGVWVEEGVDTSAPERTIIAADSDAGRSFLAAYPELSALASLGNVVVFTVDGETIELHSEKGTPPP